MLVYHDDEQMAGLKWPEEEAAYESGWKKATLDPTIAGFDLLTSFVDIGIKSVSFEAEMKVMTCDIFRHFFTAGEQG